MNNHQLFINIVDNQVDELLIKDIVNDEVIGQFIYLLRK